MNKELETEYAFTLIEILIVIIIIGILAATAIPIFLDQRRVANDAAVTSDVRTVAMLLETELIEHPNASNFSSEYRAANNSIAITLEDEEEVTLPLFSLTEGVVLSVSNLGKAANDNMRPFNYRIQGYHIDGKKYRSVDTAQVYDSSSGGLLN